MTKTANFSHEVEIFNSTGESKCSLSYKSIEDNKPIIKNLEYEKKKISDLVIINLVLEFGVFDYTELDRIHIKNTDIFGGIATDTMFIDCMISDSIFYACTFYGSAFNNFTFYNVLFRRTNLAEIIFNKYTFNNCKFTSDGINHFTDLSGTVFLDCTVNKTIFNDIDINKDTKLPL